MGEDNPFIWIQQRAAIFWDAGPHHRHCPLRIPDGETAICAAFCTLHWQHWSGEGENSWTITTLWCAVLWLLLESLLTSTIIFGIDFKGVNDSSSVGYGYPETPCLCPYTRLFMHIFAQAWYSQSFCETCCQVKKWLVTPCVLEAAPVSLQPL